MEGMKGFTSQQQIYLHIIINLSSGVSLQSAAMSHAYYDFKTLEEGSRQMVELIKEVYSDTDGPVHPDPKPGFLRHALAESAPEEGSTIEHLLERTRSAIVPGIMNWQSPKYFGYYPSSINVTSVLAEMFATTFQTPNFSYAVAPSFTELENTMVDWSAKAVGLPDRFLLRSEGGGIINNSATESIFNSAHVAKFSKLKELKLAGNNPEVLKLVGYFGQGNHISSERALALKDIYYRRPVPYRYDPQRLNYEIDYDKFVEIVEADVQAGLIPFWFSGSWGNTFSAAIDTNLRVVELCKKHGMWVHIDAAFLGSTWICEQYRPKEPLLERIDSICINFTKLLLNGTGGSLFYVSDKRIVCEAFGGNALQFAFFKNHFTDNYDVVDYKDWIVGLARRNNAIKLYYTFLHYGLKRLRQSVVEQEEKAARLVGTIRAHPELFQVHTVQYSLVLFQVRGKDGQPSNELTKSVAARIKNCKEGFCSPAEFAGTYAIRIVVGNFHSTDQHVQAYIARIIQEARDQQAAL